MSHLRSRLVFRATSVMGSLKCITPMALINCLLPTTRGNDQFVDRYVLVAPVVPLVLLTAYPFLPFLQYAWPLAIWRVCEIIIVLLNTLLFDDYRDALEFKKPKALAGLRRPLVLLPFTYADLILWFAYVYRFLIVPLRAPSYRAWIDAVNLSFVRISAFGSSSVETNCPLITSIMLAESAVGLFMGLAAISWFVSLIPSRETADAVERRIKRNRRP